MKKFQRFLMILMIGVGVALGPCALTSLARPNPPFDGHGHGHGREHEKGWKHRGSWHEGHGREHWDNGRHRGWYRDHRGYYRFRDDERRLFVSYFRNHEDEDEDWFHERGPRGVAISIGYVVAPRYRGYCHPLPPPMLEELPPPPPRHHYFIFGGNVVLMDSGYRVQDFISLNFNFSR